MQQLSDMAFSSNIFTIHQLWLRLLCICCFPLEQMNIYNSMYIFKYLLC